MSEDKTRAWLTVMPTNPKNHAISMRRVAGSGGLYEEGPLNTLRIQEGQRLLLIDLADLPEFIQALQHFLPSPLEALARIAE